MFNSLFFCPDYCYFGNISEKEITRVRLDRYDFCFLPISSKLRNFVFKFSIYLALVFLQSAEETPQKARNLQRMLAMLQVFLVAVDFGVCLIIFVFFPPLDEEGQAVDRACLGWMITCRLS